MGAMTTCAARFARRGALAAATLAFVVHATSGQADDAMPPAPPAPREQTETRHWYGYQTLIVDSVALGLGGAGVGLVAGRHGDTTAGDAALPIGLMGFGLLTYVFAAPTVHWVHRRTLAGFASLGLRLLTPLLGAGIGALIPGIAGYDNTAGGIAGTIAGAGTAIALDAIFLGYETVPTVRF
jgi:hypothetical protein